MMVLHCGSGARDFELHDEVFSDEQWDRIKQTTCDLLKTRGLMAPAIFFEGLPFSLFDATNNFGDEFCVLFAKLPMDKYLEESWANEEMQESTYASTVAKVLSEICSRYVRFVAVELDINPTPSLVATPRLQVTSQSVERALADAEKIIFTRDAISAVDRVHTAFHGYLRAVVGRMGMEVVKDASATQLFKIIRENHSAFKDVSSADDEVNKILRAIASILDALGPIRNRSSIAHPNEMLIQEPEAMLVINTVRTLLHYLDAKIGGLG